MKNLSKVLKTFENSMEKGTNAPGANVLFFIFLSNTGYFKGTNRRYYGVKRLGGIVIFGPGTNVNSVPGLISQTNTINGQKK